MEQIQNLISDNMMSEINISYTSSLYSLVSTIVAAYVLRELYVRYGRSMNNREYFANTFILLGITTATVIIIVKYSLALSLGLVGALSIVRFRAAIKEPEELVYLFLIIAFGLAFGSNQFSVGFLLLSIAAIVIILGNRLIKPASSFDYSGSVIILTGKKDDFFDFAATEFYRSLEDSQNTLIKELTIASSNSRLVVRLNTSDIGGITIKTFTEYAQSNNLDISIVSDVSVPA